jgi:formylglycine-generating enzyme required for sulfatase activity
VAEPLSPIGFWSYTSSDDRNARSHLSQLRRLLAEQLQLVIGRRQIVSIFQDEVAIPLGATWREQIYKALDESSFLIPIVTPAFLESEWCCREVQHFSEREQRLGRNDLIFPFHYINVADIHPSEVHDPKVLDLLQARQRFDFASLRHRAVDAEPVRERLADLAVAIRSALRRGMTSDPLAPAATSRPGAAATRAEGRATADPPVAAPPAPASPSPAEPRGPAIVSPPAAGTIIREAPGPEMVLIPAGSFVMGSPDSEPGQYHDEGPAHRVTIARPFWLGRYPVTRGEYAVFAGETGHGDNQWQDPGFPQDDRHPVVNVSHQDAEAYVAWLSAKTRQTYRLPSEAEWEYAARAGTIAARYWGEAAGEPGKHARFSKERGDAGGTAPVGCFPPNPFGLYDMLGNVWEWCADPWHDTYLGAPTEGSVWANGGAAGRVLRGGSWFNAARGVRSAYRTPVVPLDRLGFVGFRCARVQQPASGAG